MYNLRSEKGNVIVETALVLPLILVLLFVSVEFMLAARASYDLNTVVRIGVETAEFGPSFNRRSTTNYLKSAGKPDTDTTFDACYFDIWNPTPFNCGHIVTHIKMNRAYLQLNNSDLKEIQYITQNDPQGRVQISIQAIYVPTFLSTIRALGSITGLNNLNFGDGIVLTAGGTSQNYFDTP